MWSVGLAVSGNEFGKTWDEYQGMPIDEVNALKQQATEKLYAAGAHYVIDTLADLPSVIEIINSRLANGEKILISIYYFFINHFFYLNGLLLFDINFQQSRPKIFCR